MQFTNYPESCSPEISKLDLAPQSFARVRADLIMKYDIASEFVRVAVLAKILGLSNATIYSSIRNSCFFLPHRMLGASPVVKLDDLVIWYCKTDLAERMPYVNVAAGGCNLAKPPEVPEVDAKKMTAKVMSRLEASRRMPPEAI